MLLSLLKTCDLLGVIFTRNDLIRYKDAITGLTEGEAFAKAVGGLVDDVEAMRASQVVMMSIVITTVT